MKKVFWFLGAILLLVLIYLVLIPAFAGNIAISPTFNLGAFSIHWYGLILAAAILASYFIIRGQAWKFGISKNDVDDFSFWTIIIAVISARIYYVLFNWPYFSQNLSETYKIWHGGISIYGAVIGTLVFAIFWTRKRVYSFWQLSDLIVLGLPVGQAIGRFGNFINQEAFGPPTNLPWKMYVAPMNRPIQYANFSFFHPTFLYEALVDLAIFILLYQLSKKGKPGTLVLTYLLTYSFFRFFIEGLRLDSLFLFGLKVDQLVAVAIFIVSGIMLLSRSRKPSPR